MDNLILLFLSSVWCACLAEAGFSTEVIHLLRRVRMPPEQTSLLPRVLRDVQRALQTRWPEAEVTPYGSIIAGIGILGSDIDISAQFPEPYFDIHEIKSILGQYPHLFQDIRAVPAMIPIVKFIHTPTGHSVDLSFRNELALKNTALMKYFMNVDDRVSDLTIIVRYWAKLHKPEQSLRGRIMSNFAIVSLVIFYLQQMRGLPSVDALQKYSETIIVNNWNTGFDEMPYRSLENTSLYELLGGFFQYYDKFDFDNTIVSTFTAYPIKRNSLKSIKQNLKNGFTPLNITSPVIIQDPFEHTLNVAREITPEILMKFKSDLKSAANAYAREARDDFLRVILDNSDFLVPLEQYTEENELY